MKNKVIVILAILILIVGAIITYILMNQKEKIEEINEEELLSFEVEVYDKVTIKDLTNEDNDIVIDTNKVGKNIVSYKVNEETKYIVVKVIDTTPPYIGLGDYYNHIKDTNFTFDKDVICADNYDRDIKCEIIGEYDLTELSETKLKVVAKDKSNNVTEKEFTLKVVEKSSPGKPEYIKLEDALKNKKANAEIMIDVSKWQEDIDWKKVKEAGVNYAMLRLGTQKNVDEDSVLDAYFEKNIKEAKENGVKVGVYYYTYANDINDAKGQAKWVIEQLKDYELDLPVAFDWECWRKFNDFNISIHDLNEIGRTFLKEVESAGYKVVNYGSKNYLEKLWDLEEYDTWVAHYTKETNYSKDYIMWQFTDSGLLSGVKGPVDFNYLYIAQ